MLVVYFAILITVLFVFSRTLTSHAEVYLRSRTYQALVKITFKLTKTNKKQTKCILMLKRSSINVQSFKHYKFGAYQLDFF